jgi:hypothetical protein
LDCYKHVINALRWVKVTSGLQANG